MDINDVLIGTGILILAVIVAILIVIRWWFDKPERDYVTWFVLHFSIGIIAIVTVATLAFTGKLESGSTAVLTGIIAYTLGATANKTGLAAKDVQPGKPGPTIKLPDGKMNVDYGNFDVDDYVNWGTKPLTWTSGKDFPTGLNLSNDGKISGKIGKAGMYFFTLEVQDSKKVMSSFNFSLEIMS